MTSGGTFPVPRDPSPPIAGFLRFIPQVTASAVVFLLVKVGLDESSAASVAEYVAAGVGAAVGAGLAALGKVCRDNPDRWYSFIGKFV